MQDENSEEETEIEWRAVLVRDVEVLEAKHSEDERHLDHAHENGAVVNFHLSVAAESVLLLVLLHEYVVSDRVHVRCQLQVFRWLLCSFFRALRLVNIVVSGLTSVLRGILLALSQRCCQQLNVVSEQLLVLVRLLYELFHEHLVLLPFSLALTPVEPLDGQLKEDVEVKHDVLQEYWCPPSTLLLLQINVQFNEDAVEDEDGAEEHLQVRLDLELGVEVDLAQQDHFQEVAGEEEADAPLNGVELLGAHDKGEHAKH